MRLAHLGHENHTGLTITPCDDRSTSVNQEVTNNDFCHLTRDNIAKPYHRSCRIHQSSDNSRHWITPASNTAPVS